MKTKFIITAAAVLVGGMSLTAQEAPKPPAPPAEGAAPAPGPGGDPKARLEEFMKRIDTNGDGKISKEEFLAFENKQSDEKFGKMDANGDGFIDKAELEEAGKKLREARGAGRPGAEGGPGAMRRPEGGGDNASRGFRRPEGGGDNPSRPRPEGGPPAGESRRAEGGGPPQGGGGMFGAEMFKRMDKDGDGNISKEEWMSANEERFKQMDLNGDGKITKEEAEEAGRKMREMMGGTGTGRSSGQGGFRRPEGGGEGGTRPRPAADAPKPLGDAPKPKEGV